MAAAAEARVDSDRGATWVEAQRGWDAWRGEEEECFVGPVTGAVEREGGAVAAAERVSACSATGGAVERGTRWARVAATDACGCC